MAEETKKGSKRTVIITLGVILAIVVIGGIAYFITRPKEAEKTVEKTGDTKSGLASLLSSLNLSGLTIFGAGS